MPPLSRRRPVSQSGTLPQSAVDADAINLQDLPEELLIKVLTFLKDSRACASAALLCRRLAAGWRGVEHLFFAEPADAAKVLLVDGEGLKKRMQQHRTRSLHFSWRDAPHKSGREARPHLGQLGLLGGWSGLMGNLEEATHLNHLERFSNIGCQLTEHIPKHDEHDTRKSYLARQLCSPAFARAMPNLRVLELEFAFAPILFKACMQTIGEFEHLEVLRFTPHPGGNAGGMYHDDVHQIFGPEGIAFWEDWAISDFNCRNGGYVESAQNTKPFSQPRLHASLSTLDLSWTRDSLSTNFWAFAHMWGHLGEELRHFRALRVLNLSGCCWGVDADEAMAAAMLSLPPTIEELHLAYLVCLEDGEQWAGRGVFAAFAALPRLIELNMEDSSLGLAPAITLATCCVPNSELHVTCDMFELSPGDAAARAKVQKRLVAMQKKLQRQLS